jgi:hypothetical protein
LQALRLLERPFKGIPANDPGEIEQGAGDAGDGNALYGSPIVGVEFADEVDGDAAASEVIGSESGYVNRLTSARPDPPQRRCALMAENGVRPTSKYGGQRPTRSRNDRVANRVHASVQTVQPTGPQPVLNCVPAESQLHELAMCDDPVLLTCQPGDVGVTRARLWAIYAHKLARFAHGAEDRIPTCPEQHALPTKAGTNRA